VPLEVEVDCHARAVAIADGLDSYRPDRSDRTFQDTPRASARWIVLGNLVGELARSAGNLSGIRGAGADPDRSFSLYPAAHQVPLPFAVPIEFVKCQDRRHRFSLVAAPATRSRLLLPPIGGLEQKRGPSWIGRLGAWRLVTAVSLRPL
jgi:hypothetical protein